MKKYQPLLFIWLVLAGHFFSLLSPQVIVGAKAAEAKTELKIGFVNPIKLMDKAPQVKKANKRLEKQFAPRQRRLVSARQELENLEKKLATDGVTMTETQAKNLRLDIREKKRKFQRDQREFGEDYNLRRNEELDKVQKIIVTAIQEFAKQEKYDLILSDGVVWASKKVDITDDVLKFLKNKKRSRKR